MTHTSESNPQLSPTFNPEILSRGGRTLVHLPLGAALRSLCRCALHVAALLIAGDIRQPSDHKGRRVRFCDGTEASVYRETVIRRAAPSEPVVLIVGFRLRRVRSRWAHALFRAESELNTVLFAGFPGLVSKLWLRRDENGLYRGIYQWDGAEPAVGYVKALWWALAAVSELGSIRYAVIPGACRDAFVGGLLPHGHSQDWPREWWRPAHVPSPNDGV